MKKLIKAHNKKVKDLVFPNPCIHLRKGAGKQLAKMVFNPADIIGIEILPALERKHKETALHKMGKRKKVEVCLFKKRKRKK